MGDLIDWVLQNGGIAVCVCDADITRENEEERKRLQSLKERFAKNENVLICDSMPSIEFWFLVHYLNTRKYFKDSQAVIRILKKYIPGYEKTGAFLEKRQWVTGMSTEEKLQQACRRAALLSPTSESYSEVYRAIKLFEETVPKSL